MASINLCIDIGNTSTKAALFVDREEVNYWKPFTIEDYKSVTSQYNVEVLVSKTGENREIEEVLSTNDYLTSSTNLPLTLNYKTPETLGPDRIATAAGVLAIDAEKPWVIIDLGTCLTLDLVVNKAFEGGLIAPGVQMRLKAMHQFTAALPLIEMDFDVKFPGKSTIESMQVGVCQSIMLEINGYIDLLNKQYY